MIKVNEIQMKIAEQLVLTVKNREPNVTYKELAERLDPPIHHRQIGRHLYAIAELCHELEIPIITAKVINKNTRLAGEGFYDLYTEYYPEDKSMSARDVFKRECKRIREFQQWDILISSEETRKEVKKIKVSEEAKQIRILPMSRMQEFQEYDIEDLQKLFFKGDLITDRNGRYYFRTSGMNAPNGSLVLFQYEGLIVASAILNEISKFDKKLDNVYAGAYDFEVSSIRTFQPITYDELQSIIPSLKPFSQVKQVIEMEYAEQLEKLIKSNENPLIPDEVADDKNMFYEGAKKTITVNSYERDYKARKECIKQYGTSCYICGFDFGKVYGSEYFAKIHVHHVVPLSEIGERYNCDPIKDLRPVCPNCHLVLHTKVDETCISIDELRNKMKA